MQIVEPSVKIIAETPDMERTIEFAIRHCYKSEDKTTEDSYKRMIDMVIKSGHTSTLEHGSVTVEFLTNRGVLAEITRHRLASFSVESTRYCNYSADHKGMKICRPAWLDRKVVDELSDCPVVTSDFYANLKKSMSENGYFEEGIEIAKTWYKAMFHCEGFYNELIEQGAKPQFARGVLPNDLAVSMVMTANVREWRTILSLRHDAEHAHPDIVHLMTLLLKELNERHPVLFPLSDFSSGDYTSRLVGFK